MKTFPLTFLPALLAGALLTSPAAQAEQADRQKPMNVEADALRYDDLHQINIFTGHVVMTKGTIVVRGARLEVRQDPDGYQYGIVTAAPGERAFFRQKRDVADEFIEGEGEQIEYNGKADTVKFIRRAEIRRYQGATLHDEVTGPVIVYNEATDVFTVDGKPQGGATGTAGARVRAMLTPKNAAQPPAAAQPAAPLQPATGLAEEKK